MTSKSVVLLWPIFKEIFQHFRLETHGLQQFSIFCQIPSVFCDMGPLVYLYIFCVVNMLYFFFDKAILGLQGIKLLHITNCMMCVVTLCFTHIISY